MLSPGLFSSANSPNRNLSVPATLRKMSPCKRIVSTQSGPRALTHLSSQTSHIVETRTTVAMHAHAPHRYVVLGGKKTCRDLFLPLLWETGNADGKKKCPGVLLACADPTCAGDETEGCINAGLNNGCPCTGKPYQPPTEVPPSDGSEAKSCYNFLICSDPDCAGEFLSPEVSLCTKPSTYGCLCTGAPLPN